MAANQAPEVDPLQTFAKRPAVSFDPNRTNDDGTPNPGHRMGEWVMLDVDGYADMVQRRDRHNKPMAYEDTGKPMMSMVLPVIENGEEKSLWSKVPGGLLTALKGAQAAMQEEVKDPSRRIGPGDKLAVRWAANGPKTSNDPTMSPPKIFEARIQPGKGPDPLAPNTSDNPFETAAGQPAAQPAPAAQPVAPQPTPVEQPRPSVGGDPFATPVTDATPASTDDPFATGAPPY